MSPKAFIASFALSAAGLLAGYGLAFNYALQAPIAAEYWLRGTLLVKERLAEAIDGPKVVFVGGSSTLFSIDTEAISDMIGRPAVNLGTHAGLPLSYHLDLAKRSLKTGDTVVVVPEYGYYRETEPNTAWFIDQVFAWNSLYFRRSPIPQKLEFMVDTPARTVINAAAAKLFSLRLLSLKPERGATDDQVLSIFRAGVESLKLHPPQQRAFQYFYNNLNEHGDIQNTVGTLSPPPQDYGLLNPAAVPDIVWGELGEFKAYCDQRGIPMFLAYAPVMTAGPVAENRDRVERRLIQLAGEAKLHDLAFIDTADSAFFAPDMFFDTSFHLNTEGRKMRSAYLARKLSDLMK